MTTTKAMFGVTCGVALLLVLLGASRQQEEDARTLVTSLQKESKAHLAVIQGHEKTIKEMEKRLLAVETWFQGLPTALAALEQGVKETADFGFTNAGANPAAREALLATLRGLAQNLKMSLPQPLAAK